MDSMKPIWAGAFALFRLCRWSLSIEFPCCNWLLFDTPLRDAADWLSAFSVTSPFARRRRPTPPPHYRLSFSLLLAIAATLHVNNTFFKSRQKQHHKQNNNGPNSAGLQSAVCGLRSNHTDNSCSAIGFVISPYSTSSCHAILGTMSCRLSHAPVWHDSYRTNHHRTNFAPTLYMYVCTSRPPLPEDPDFLIW